MAAPTFVIEIATPERRLAREFVTDAQVPAESGYLGILPGHAPLLAELGDGELSYTLPSGEKHALGVHGGWVEINGDSVRILANSAEHPNEIDLARAEAAAKRAAERLLKPGIDVARALNARRRAESRVAIAKQASRS